MSQAWPDAQSAGPLQPQEPPAHAVPLVVATQVPHRPAIPQLLLSLVPATHMFKLPPLMPQQPLLQREPALQVIVHVLPVHAWPGGQSPATLHSMHIPVEEQIGVVPMHGAAHMPPPCPQALEVSPGWQLVPLQHPW
jgi:hypothetical protein